MAQGINLPAEAVILAGDDRWDQVTNKPEALLVHEVLNAAGRAGRAGSHSHGFVINIPANGPYVIEGCNFDSMPEDQQDQCLGLFGRPDQCFEVYDPIERALDYVATLDELDDDAEYFVRRMSALSDDQLSGVISRTLGKFKSEHPPAVEDQVQFIQELSATTDTDTELARIAGEIGIPAHTVREIVETCGAIDLDQSFSDLQESLWTWLISSQEVLQSLDPGILTAIKRILPVDDLNGEDVANWTIRWVDALLQTLPAWTSGSPLVDVGAFLFDRRGNKRAKTSAIALGRLFSLGVNSNIAYCISLVCACIQRHRTDLSPRQLAILAVLPGATREGFNIPDQLLTYNALLRHRGLYPRVKVHQIFSMVAERLSPWEPGVDLDSRAAEVRRIANAAI
ncbi:MAG: hypothetical protein FKY71_15970 [Spiribacter salinus]|uniref:Helicase C-terminal domain-containing protein n=1 Tax=Spiribacter salinus TaxID=1335746 RepID=A0A540VLA1_9GAMM|nr:MAG: hypothetical protein FKY71_15970 [Spiribacter salinus]